jgi:hypothetical protein
MLSVAAASAALTAAGCGESDKPKPAPDTNVAKTGQCPVKDKVIGKGEEAFLPLESGGIINVLNLGKQKSELTMGATVRKAVQVMLNPEDPGKGDGAIPKPLQDAILNGGMISSSIQLVDEDKSKYHVEVKNRPQAPDVAVSICIGGLAAAK